MEDFGGYPPFQQCDGEEPAAPPAGDACPPAASAAAAAVEVSESCTPHCGRDGVCHSHNILGDCVWTVDWVLSPKLGDANMTKIVMFKGDTLTFRHSMNDGLAHNLFQLSDGAALEACAFDGASELANVVDVSIGHDITFDVAGEYHFTCGIGCTGAMAATMGGAISAEVRQGGFCHCDVGQKLLVEVKDASEGMRCHSHGSDHGHDHARRRAAAEGCAEGSAAAFVVGDANYGAASAGECVELCASAMALAWMPGVAEGACAAQGYPDRIEEKMVLPAGSPMELAVTIYSAESDSDADCHCHSYEEIVCPGADADDALYDEHIEEITSHCQGVLDGTEADCPYLCYQPMEVLHLHYLECPSREVHETYAAVDARGLCHGGSTDVPGDMKTAEMCPVVEVEQAHADGHGHEHDDKDGHDHGHDHGHSHDHSHASADTEAVAEETVAQGSAMEDENAAPCTLYGSVFMAGLSLTATMLLI